MVPRNSSALPVKVRRQESKRKAVVRECGEERREIETVEERCGGGKRVRSRRLRTYDLGTRTSSDPITQLVGSSNGRRSLMELII